MATFNPVSLDEFKHNTPRFALALERQPFDFMGELNQYEAFRDMKALTDSIHYPAIAGVLHRIYEPLKRVPDEERDAVKQALGAFVCAVMLKNGYSKTGIKRNVPPVPDRLFFKAEVYEQVGAKQGVAA